MTGSELLPDADHELVRLALSGDEEAFGELVVGVGQDWNPFTSAKRVSAILEDGKPTVVSQTADPASDRVVKVELKATIVK